MFSVSTKNHPAMQSDLLQQELFDHIRSVMPANRSLADAIADLLRISSDSAYRRIRGEKSLSFAELQKLSTHFRISLDAILNIDSRSAVFYGNWQRARGFNFKEYLGGLLEHIENVAASVRQAFHYEAKDLFPTHYLAFPELAAFKYFYWIRSILNHPAYAETAFEQHDLSEVLAELSPAIIKASNAIATTEIWSDETINSTLAQISRYRRQGIIKDAATADRLYAAVSALLTQVQSQAETGRKFAPGAAPTKYSGTYQLCYNPLYPGHNTILTEADGMETVFVDQCVLNMMMTNDPEFCSNTRRYFDDAIAHASSLNGPNNTLREDYFASQQQKIRDAQVAAS